MAAHVQDPVGCRVPCDDLIESRIEQAKQGQIIVNLIECYDAQSQTIKDMSGKLTDYVKKVDRYILIQEEQGKERAARLGGMRWVTDKLIDLAGNGLVVAGVLWVLSHLK